MFNKKALGVQWYLLLFGMIVAVGVVAILQFTSDIPNVGEYSASMIKELEKNSITPEIIGRIIEKINEVSVDDLKEIEGLISDPERFDSYCEGSYKDKIRYKRFMIDYSRGRVAVHCLVNERNLKSDFVTIFNKNYDAFRPPLLEEDDVKYYIWYFRKIKDGEYLDVIQQRRGYELTIPLTVGPEGNRKDIGEFSINPIFKFPVQDSSSVAYDFDVDGTARERCIFSAGCATCQDVIDRYPERDYKIRKWRCIDYLGCTEVTDGTSPYRCGREKLCEGACTPYCSSDRYTEDQTTTTNCRDDCSKYEGCNEEVIDACYCPDSLIGSLDKCTGTCLFYCSNPSEGKTEDTRSNTNCQENLCDSYSQCVSTSACACSNDYACDGACVPYCSSDDDSKTVDEDTNTNCQSDHCSSNIYVPGTCDSTLACYCPMSSFECDGDCELCDYRDWADAGGGCGEGVCSDTQILQQKVSTNGCPTQTQCDDRESLCKPYCSNPPEGEIDDGVDDTKCLIGDCADDYANCITTDSCGCANGKNPCMGACTAA